MTLSVEKYAANVSALSVALMRMTCGRDGEKKQAQAGAQVRQSCRLFRCLTRTLYCHTVCYCTKGSLSHTYIQPAAHPLFRSHSITLDHTITLSHSVRLCHKSLSSTL